MGYALQHRRFAGVRPARALAATAATLLVLATAGCGDEQPAEAAKESGVVVYFVQDGALKPVAQESSAKVESMSPQGRAALAVKTLLQDEPAEDASHDTLWGRSCVSGASVKSLTNNGGKITLSLGGAGSQVCTKTGAEDVLQQQQLAWTVVENFEVDPATPIKVIGPNGAAVWQGLVADEKVLAD